MWEIVGAISICYLLYLVVNFVGGMLIGWLKGR